MNKWEIQKNIIIEGDLSGGEFYSVRENIKDILNNMKSIETGQPIFKIRDTKVGFVLEADKEYINKTPEQHILINGLRYKVLEFFKMHPASGDHDGTDAIIIISGRNIRHQLRLKDASIYDITLTVLYLLGLPLAADMPGKVIVDAIDASYLIKNYPRYIKTYESDKKQVLPKPIRSPAEEERIKERMRSLGYIN